MGWDNASTFAGEVEAPGRSYPLAMVLGVVLVSASYVLPVLAGASTGMAAGSWSAGSWGEAAERLGGRGLAALVVAGGVVTVVAMFNASLLSWSRLPVALAEGGWLPSTFARRSDRTGAPASAILLGAVLCAAVVGLGFLRLVELDVLLYGGGLVLELVALVVLRVREPGLHRPFRVPGGLPGAVLAAALPTALLAFAAWEGRAEPGAFGLSAVEVAALVASLGVPWWIARRPRSGRPPPARPGD
jgi:amino acid transporter